MPRQIRCDHPGLAQWVARVEGKTVPGPGGLVAFIRMEGKSAEPDQLPPTSLWIRDTGSGSVRRVLGPRPSDDPKTNMQTFAGPAWSPDGHYIYVMAQAWLTSGAVHQVDVATGAERFVVDGYSLDVLPDGDLVVMRHQFNEDGPVTWPCYRVSPDAKQQSVVPCLR